MSENQPEQSQNFETKHDHYVQIRLIDRTLRHLTTIAETANEGIAITDVRGVLRFANAALAWMHGYESPKALIGKSISFFHSHEQMHSDVLPLIAEAQRRGDIAGPVEHINSDGIVFPTRTRIVLLRDPAGKAEGFAFFIVDLSERIQNERLLTERNDQLITANERLKNDISEHQKVFEQISISVDEMYDLL